jgi:hypothetical protein
MTMEALHSFETSVTTDQSKWRSITENWNHQQYRYENLEFRTPSLLLPNPAVLSPSYGTEHNKQPSSSYTIDRHTEQQKDTHRPDVTQPV